MQSIITSRYMKNYMKICQFLHDHFTETMNVVENLLKKALVEKLHLLKKHNNVVGIHWNLRTSTEEQW